jgi:hypothetical protein
MSAPYFFPHRQPMLGAPFKPPFGLTLISCHAVLKRSACAPFSKERRMKCINATSLSRKSGQWGTQHLSPVWESLTRSIRRVLVLYQGTTLVGPYRIEKGLGFSP